MLLHISGALNTKTLLLNLWQFGELINNAYGEVKQPICGKEPGTKAMLWNCYYSRIVGFHDPELKISEREKRIVSFIHKGCACLFCMQAR